MFIIFLYNNYKYRFTSLDEWNFIFYTTTMLSAIPVNASLNNQIYKYPRKEDKPKKKKINRNKN